MNKVVLALVDGMRPDGLTGCGHPFVPTLLAASAYTLTGRTVYPSVTLPCHMSLFHSVDPERHGVLTNTWTPQVRPIPGLVEQLDAHGCKCAFFYTWEELRDLTRPDHLHHSLCLNQHRQQDTDTRITEAAIGYIQAEEPDFLFLYLGETDEAGGHDTGWMSETYMGCVRKAVGCLERLQDSLPEGYTLIVLADHGGHGRSHGSDMPEDMTIPVCLWGPAFTPGQILEDVSIKDIAPTIAALLGIPPVRGWEGRSLLPSP
ncbi:MAG: alkaline phosphatase family protein [Aristaeellaceae bacterium]